MQSLPKVSGEYLSALHNLCSLKLYTIKIEHIGEEGFRTCFSAFRETLTHLTLDNFCTSFSAFVALVDYFPNITSLQVGLFFVKPDKEPVRALSRPLRGKISLRHIINDSCMAFFNRLVELDLEYEELVIEDNCRATTKLLESVLQLSASTVKYLKLHIASQCECPYYASSSLRILTRALAF